MATSTPTPTARPMKQAAPSANGGAPIIRLRDLHKNFGSQIVLDGLSMDIQPAKTTVIMGPSGCGKSVTLKHIVGLLRPDSGEIEFDGHRIDKLSEAQLAPIRLQ